MKHFARFLAFLTLAAGCAGEETLIPDAGAGYFPLATGIFQVYSVHEVHYTGGSGPVIADYQLMTEVSDSFPSGNEGFTYVIHRSRRSGDADPWEPLDTWSVRREGNDFVVSEGNTPFLKMRLPVRAGMRWDGNRYNALGTDEYLLQGVGESMVFSGMTFEKTTTVEQEQNEDLIVYQDRRTEVYAHGVGLIYKETIQLTYCTADHCLGQQEIDQGTELTMEIKEYGKH